MFEQISTLSKEVEFIEDFRSKHYISGFEPDRMEVMGTDLGVFASGYSDIESYFGGTLYAYGLQRLGGLSSKDRHSKMEILRVGRDAFKEAHRGAKNDVVFLEFSPMKVGNELDTGFVAVKLLSVEVGEVGAGTAS